MKMADLSPEKHKEWDEIVDKLTDEVNAKEGVTSDNFLDTYRPLWIEAARKFAAENNAEPPV